MNILNPLQRPLGNAEIFLLADENDRVTCVVSITLDEILFAGQQTSQLAGTQAQIDLDFLCEKVGDGLAIKEQEINVVGHLHNLLYIQVVCDIVTLPDPSTWTISECQKFLDHKLGIDCNILDHISDDDVEEWRAEVARRLDEIELEEDPDDPDLPDA